MTLFLVLALGLVEPVKRRHSQATALAAIDFFILDPVKQGVGYTGDLRRNRFNGCTQRWVVASVLLQQPNRTLPDFG